MEESNTTQEQPTSDASVSAVPAPAPTPEELKKDQIRKYYTELQKQNYEKCIQVVMGQTTYSREEAIAGLEKHKGNVMLVVKEFLGIPDKNNSETSSGGSLNQKRYGVIRDFMDKAATSYTKTQERNKIMNQMVERQKKLREDSLQANATSNTIVSSTEPSTQS
jgi:hypothetical protein